MIRRFIIFLIRRRLGLKKFEGFRFVNQKSVNDWYFFGDEFIWKSPNGYGLELSNVSLNWLLDGKCEIKKINVRCEKFNEIQRFVNEQKENQETK